MGGHGVQWGRLSNSVGPKEAARMRGEMAVVIARR